MLNKLLEVKDLRVSFYTSFREIQAVRGVSFELSQGEAVAIVGESGCGKSVMAQAIMGLIPEPPGKIIGGRVVFGGVDIIQLPEKEVRKIRGKDISIIFQDPMTSLNPTMTIGKQISEVLILHRKLSSSDAIKEVKELLKMVGFSYPEKRIKQYPHELSGGMRQRVTIAMALACQPKILIADEPTTALDVTTQAQIIELLKDIKIKMGTSIIMITHNLGVIAGLATQVMVMYAGKIVESGSIREIFYHARHPYTWGLLKSMPQLNELQNKKLTFIKGQPPDLSKPLEGCSFAPRCTYAMGICHKIPPETFEIRERRMVACWLEHSQASPNKGRF